MGNRLTAERSDWSLTKEIAMSLLGCAQVA
jgi:hypothetical protein